MLISSLAVVIAILFLLLPKLSQRVTADTAGYYVPILVTPNPSTGTMQLQTIQFKFIAFTPTPTPPTNPNQNPSGQQNSCNNASKNLIWLNSAARAQYNSDAEWLVWSWSACSGDSMAMVFNSFTGGHLKIGDVLETESHLGVWDFLNGLHGDTGFGATGNAYGFHTDISYTRSLDQIINIANNGQPVIVIVVHNSHIMVLTGGDNQYVYLADPGPHNYKRLTRSQFTNGGFDGFSSFWTGESILMKPNACQ